MRRKLVKIGKKFITFTLAAAMVVQPATGIPFASSMVVSAEESTPEIAIERQVQGEDLIKNGNFSTSISTNDASDTDWIFMANDGAAGTATCDNDGGVDVKIDALGQYAWSIQLYQWLTVEEGKRYQVEFDVEAEQGGSFVLGVQEQGGGYKHILAGNEDAGETITLTAGEKKKITRVTLATPESFLTNKNGCKLVFMFNNEGNAGKTIKISNVSMKEYVPEEEKPEDKPGNKVEENAPEIGSTMQATDKDGNSNTWKLLWSDEFSDGTLDLTKWDYQDGNGTKYGGADLAGWGNDEKQIYTDGNQYGSKNLKVTDGKLVITAKKEADGTYSSARIWTKSDDYNEKKTDKPLFAKKYGRIEAKMELPSADDDALTGAWPAFWMMPLDDVYGSWARSGELDIMEARGRVKNSVDGTIHYGKTWPDNKNTGGSYTKDDFDIRQEHVYAVEWLPGKISWYVDGVCYYSTSNWFSTSTDNAENFTYPAPYDQEFYILLNLAVGGNYDENKLNENWTEAQMKVDYVRVYDLLGDNEEVYDYAADEKTVEAAGFGSNGGLLGGSLNENLFDGNLTDAKEITEHKTGIDGWYLQCGNGGAASVSAAEEGAKVEISNAGTATYSIQLMNQVPLTAGYHYELSFEAKADASRNMIAQMGDFKDGFVGSWNKYSDGFTADLSTSWDTYTYEFDMVDATDETARLELNFGQSSTESVYIRNVTLKATDKTKILEPDDEKAPIVSGEHIYNGTFDQGNEKNDQNEYTRLRFWSTTGGATAKVNDARQAVITKGTDENAALVQKNVQLLGKEKYKITLSADGTSGQSITVKVTGSDGTEYTSQEVALGEGIKEVEFTVPDTAAAEYGDIAIVVGNTNDDVTIDNVSMKRLTNYSQDFSGIKVYPLNNGDFSQGLTGWGTFLDGGVLEASVDEGVCTIPTAPHGNAWNRMLTQDVDIVKGQTYEFSFSYKSDKPNQIISAKIETGDYKPAMDETKVTAGTDWQKETVTFTAKQGGRVTLKFLLASVSENCNISLKDIDLCIANTGVKRPPVFVADSGMVKIGQNFVYTVQVKAEDEDAWNAAEKSVTVNDETVNATYDAETKKLTIPASAFANPGAYTIVIKAKGFDFAQLYDQKIYDTTGNFMVNGDFASGKAPWGDYTHNSSATTNYDNGYFAANYLHGEGTDYGKIAAWSIQLFQTISVPESGNYTLNFVASSQVERYIKIEFGTEQKAVKIENTPKLYSVDFSGLEAKDYKVNFCLGPVNEDGTEMDADGFVDFEPHWIFMDDISFVPEGTTVSPTIPDAFEIPGETKVDAAKPQISTQPQGGEYEVGEEVTLRVAASVSDTGTLKYQWYSNTTNDTTSGTAITGATNANYTWTVSELGTTYYYCVVTNTNDAVSGTQTATAITNAVAVTVTQQQSQTTKYTVTFNSDGGSNVDSQKVESGKTATEPAAPTKDGYTFAGWYNGDTKYEFSTPVESDLTLTARWTKNDDSKNPGAGGSNPGQGGNDPGAGGNNSGAGQVKVSQIKITGISKKIAAGKKITLNANVTPADASNKDVEWTSSNEKYATVNSKGVVTTKKAGVGKTVTITATAKDGSNEKATYKISLMNKAVKKVKLTAKTKTVKAGKKLTVKAAVTLSGKIDKKSKSTKANKTLSWKSSNEKYATVSSKGVVTAKKAGKGKTVTITATATDGSGKKGTIKIKISK